MRTLPTSLLDSGMPSPPESAITLYSSQKAEEPDLREIIRERNRQRKLDDAAAERKRKGKRTTTSCPC
jgi:hypothetical protein